MHKDLVWQARCTGLPWECSVVGHSLAWNCPPVAESVVSLSCGEVLRHNQQYPVKHLTTGENRIMIKTGVLVMDMVFRMAVLKVYHSILDSVTSSQEVDTVYLDLSKAFDKVSHNPLLHKLEMCGISGTLLSWFWSYLTDRQQRVVIDGCFSNWLPMTPGVPQRSILDLIIFPLIQPLLSFTLLLSSNFIELLITLQLISCCSWCNSLFFSRHSLISLCLTAL